MLAIPTSYYGLNSGPQPAIVVAIVLGSVAGFLLVFWLFLTCLSFGGRPSFSGFTWPGRRRGNEEEVVVVRQDSVSSPSSPSGSPPPRRPRRERVVVEETSFATRRRGSGRPFRGDRERVREVPRGVEGEVRFLDLIEAFVLLTESGRVYLARTELLCKERISGIQNVFMREIEAVMLVVILYII
jgi:hypothetical protein